MKPYYSLSAALIKVIRLCCVFTGLLIGRSAVAQGPSNDLCAGALPITCGQTLSGTTVGATTAGDPTAACAGVTITSPGVFYVFTATRTGLHTVSTCTNTPPIPNALDTKLIVYSGTCGALQCLAANNDQGPASSCSGSPLTSTVEFLAVTGTTYYFFVTGNGTNTGAFNLSLTCPPAGADAAVRALYTFGQAAAPYVTPHAPQAVITNTGSTTLTNLPVTLAINGATIFTDTKLISSLAPGASSTVTFAPYSLSTGSNVLYVNVPADADLTNNGAMAQQLVTIPTLAYVHPSANLNTGFQFGQANSQFVVRYQITNIATVQGITVNFLPRPVGSTYRMRIYDASSSGGVPGAVLFASPALTAPTAGGFVVVPVPGTVVVSGSFFVAIEQVTTDPLGLAGDTEVPLRPNTFYTGSTSATMFSPLTIPFRASLGVNLAVVPLSQRAAWSDALQVSPNPADEQLTVVLPESLVGKPVELTLLSSLGQVVHRQQASTLRTSLDVSHLAAGYYSLCVRSGESVVVRKVMLR